MYFIKYFILDILLKNIKIISPDENKNLVTDLFIENGYISDTIYREDINKNVKVLDCSGKTAVPGLFDMHVHFREPGAEYKEDINSGIQAAANGGFTGVLMMPNTNPPVSDRKIISLLKEKVNGKIVDVIFSATVTKNRKGAEINNIKECLEENIVAFTDDGSPVSSPRIMSEILRLSSEYGFIVMQHAEDENLFDNGVINEGNISRMLNLKGIPAESEVSAVTQDIAIAEKNIGSRYHIQHISSGDTCELLSGARKFNKNITAEVCPHHFILTDEIIPEQGSNAKMNPPLRTKNDVERIIKGIQDGDICAICTDHAPHSLEEKNSPIEKSPFGIIGLETSVALSYTYLVSNNKISFERLIYLMSINPRKLLKLPEIKFSKGEKANITILDIGAHWTIDKNSFKSKSRNTPFDGYKVVCKPYAIINNNQICFSEL